MDRNSPKRRKIYYVPGSISLLILPILFIAYARRFEKTTTRTGIPILWIDPEILQRYPGIFPDPFPPARNYAEIYLTGNSETDRTKLDFAQVRIREILNEKDTLQGIYFHFGDKARYGSFIRALDMLRLEGAQTYIAMGTGLWFLYFPPVKAIEHDRSQPRFLPDDVVFVQPKLSAWRKTLLALHRTWKHSWELILAFLSFLLGIAMLRRKR